MRYNELREPEACMHDTMIALRRLQDDQEEIFGDDAPGLFIEEISPLAGWSVHKVRAAIKRGIANGLIDAIPLANNGDTAKCSYKIAGKE